MTNSNPGTELEPDSAALLRKLRTGGGELLHSVDLESLRAKMAGFMQAHGPDPLPVEAWEDRRLTIDNREIAARIYWPPAVRDNGAARKARPLPPVVLYFHGGGFTHFSAATHDPVARYLCNRGNAIVVNVDYRLAPEHKFPAPLQDAYDTLCWVAGNAAALGADAENIVVTGESAGGTISIALCLMTKMHSGPPIALQIPMCPALTLSDNAQYASWRKFGDGAYLLSRQALEDLRSLYLDSLQDSLNPLASPILATDLRGLPPALVITAQFDPLVDEAAHYAARLREANVPVVYRCFDGTLHSFMILAGSISVGYTALDLVAEHIVRLADREKSPE